MDHDMGMKSLGQKLSMATILFHKRELGGAYILDDITAVILRVNMRHAKPKAARHSATFPGLSAKSRCTTAD
jgi:hypothetical protein